MKPPYAIGSVPSLSGHAIAYRWRSLPRVRPHRASKPQGSSERVLPWQVTMDQLILASLSHTHYWYEVGMLKVPCQFVYPKEAVRTGVGRKDKHRVDRTLCGSGQIVRYCKWYNVDVLLYRSKIAEGKFLCAFSSILSHTGGGLPAFNSRWGCLRRAHGLGVLSSFACLFRVFYPPVRDILQLKGLGGGEKKIKF